MKKIFIILLVITIELCFLTNYYQPVFIEKIDLKLKDDELAIIFLKQAILIKNNKNNILLNINFKDINKIKKNLDDFNIKQIDNLINIDELESITINDINILNENNNVKINYLYNSFCIYRTENIDCNYIYLLNPNKNISFNKEPTLILYEKLDEEFLEIMYDKWIDTYYLEENYYNILKINKENYNIINIPNKN